MLSESPRGRDDVTQAHFKGTSTDTAEKRLTLLGDVLTPIPTLASTGQRTRTVLVEHVDHLS